ncbi:CRISPR-associated ring nuclease Csm6 [Gilvimarinus sp. SDUM040013]|uniref:CRISPR-associated ring nuclease Csm6 n=2 Tax=Gilvimarinus gilvus TaxID=3058038 RepID=A0ABU4RX62_9GAMM|nr:CRISPR-associated ring nuclease Csm6 [Gilvimarinus sp. SDUM040013]MDO3386623.1 CRISPR-associated ring nuclease Csm6 [Gilvimarinus sp. SDUM040013]MDX6849490.1 CRISPR-associated ring nuclease Csm6 [Gilvimarinus sp. SDUM040013]
MRRILILPVGLIPQVVTEAIYALAMETPQWIPTDVVLITTATGLERIETQLLPEGDNWLGKLVEEYELPEITINRKEIKVLEDSTCTPIKDTRSERELMIAANTITELLREYCNDESTEVHTVISGARTALGFYLGYAMSLYGRMDDRLSHVWVHPEFEKHPSFFYPHRDSRTIYSLSSPEKALEASQAAVELVDIPFVRLRYGLTNQQIEAPLSFTDLIQTVQKRVKTPELVFATKSNKVFADGHEVPMPPSTFSWFLWLALRHVDYPHPDNLIKANDATLALEYLDVYKSIVGEMSYEYETASEILSQGIEREYIWEKNSRIKKNLKCVLGERADIYDVASFSSRPNTLYGLDIKRSHIRISN